MSDDTFSATTAASGFPLGLAEPRSQPRLMISPREDNIDKGLMSIESSDEDELLSPPLLRLSVICQPGETLLAQSPQRGKAKPPTSVGRCQRQPSNTEQQEEEEQQQQRPSRRQQRCHHARPHFPQPQLPLSLPRAVPLTAEEEARALDEMRRKELSNRFRVTTRCLSPGAHLDQTLSLETASTFLIDGSKVGKLEDQASENAASAPPTAPLGE